MEVSQVQSLSQSIVATGFPYSRATNPHNNSKEFIQIMPRVQGIRRGGSAALDMAYVACGRLDGYWEFHIKPWDVAGGGLLVKEAGGYLTTASNRPWTLKSTSVVVGNQSIHQKLVDRIKV